MAQPISDFPDGAAAAGLFATKGDLADDYADATQFLVDIGIVSGINGNLALASTLSRAQFAALVYMAYTGYADIADDPINWGGGTPFFNDTAAGAWYTPYTNWFGAHGYSQGVGGGNFAPNRDISVHEAILLCLKTIGLNTVDIVATTNVTVREWTYSELNVLIAATRASGPSGTANFLSGFSWDGEGTMNRMEAFYLINRTLRSPQFGPSAFVGDTPAQFAANQSLTNLLAGEWGILEGRFVIVSDGTWFTTNNPAGYGARIQRRDNGGWNWGTTYYLTTAQTTALGITLDDVFVDIDITFEQGWNQPLGIATVGQVYGRPAVSRDQVKDIYASTATRWGDSGDRLSSRLGLSGNDTARYMGGPIFYGSFDNAATWSSLTFDEGSLTRAIVKNIGVWNGNAYVDNADRITHVFNVPYTYYRARVETRNDHPIFYNRGFTFHPANGGDNTGNNELRRVARVRGGSAISSYDHTLVYGIGAPGTGQRRGIIKLEATAAAQIVRTANNFASFTAGGTTYEAIGAGVGNRGTGADTAVSPAGANAFTNFTIDANQVFRVGNDVNLFLWQGKVVTARVVEQAAPPAAPLGVLVGSRTVVTTGRDDFLGMTAADVRYETSVTIRMEDNRLLRGVRLTATPGTALRDRQIAQFTQGANMPATGATAPTIIADGTVFQVVEAADGSVALRAHDWATITSPSSNHQPNFNTAPNNFSNRFPATGWSGLSGRFLDNDSVLFVQLTTGGWTALKGRNVSTSAFTTGTGTISNLSFNFRDTNNNLGTDGIANNQVIRAARIIIGGNSEVATPPDIVAWGTVIGGWYTGQNPEDGSAWREIQVLNNEGEIETLLNVTGTISSLTNGVAFKYTKCADGFASINGWLETYANTHEIHYDMTGTPWVGGNIAPVGGDRTLRGISTATNTLRVSTSGFANDDSNAMFNYVPSGENQVKFYYIDGQNSRMLDFDGVASVTGVDSNRRPHVILDRSGADGDNRVRTVIIIRCNGGGAAANDATCSCDSK
jgi:hypothetical protein